MPGQITPQRAHLSTQLFRRGAQQIDSIGVVDRERNTVGERFQQGQVIVAEDLAMDRIEDFDHPQAGAVNHQQCRDNRARLKSGVLVD